MDILNKANFNMIKIIGYFICSLFLLVFFVKCKTTKIVKDENPVFNITEASFNKMVPGEKDQEIKVKLTIFMDKLNESILFDSILFKGNSIKLNNRNIKEKLFIAVELKETAVKENNYNSLDVKNNHALLFYTNNKKSYFYHLKEIQEKEDVYLP